MQGQINTEYKLPTPVPVLSLTIDKDQDNDMSSMDMRSGGKAKSGERNMGNPLHDAKK